MLNWEVKKNQWLTKRTWVNLHEHILRMWRGFLYDNVTNMDKVEEPWTFQKPSKFNVKPKALNINEQWGLSGYHMKTYPIECMHSSSYTNRNFD